MKSFLNESLRGLEPYTPGEQPKVRGRLIKLNTNENPYGPSPAVVRALKEADAAELALYPDPDGTELAESIAAACGTVPERIMAGNGSDEILAFIFLGFGEKICFPAISYGFYSVFADVFGCDAEAIPLEPDLSVDLDKFKAAEGTAVIANPNAPTGIAFARDELEPLISADPDRLVVVDEAYVDFGAETCVPLTEKYENLLIVRTASKSLGLAGLRVGWCVGCEALIGDMKKLKFSFNPYNVDRLAMSAAKAALDDRAYFDMTREMVIATRERATRALNDMGFETTRSSANFIFAKCDKISGEEYFKKLRERNIIVRHFGDERINEYVRITVGTDEEMDILLRETRDILKEAEK